MMTMEEVCARYSVQLDTHKPSASAGLSADVILARLLQYGPNVMSPPKQIPAIIKFLICLSNLFNVLLIIAGILCYVLYGIDPIGNASNVFTFALC